MDPAFLEFLNGKSMADEFKTMTTDQKLKMIELYGTEKGSVCLSYLVCWSHCFDLWLRFMLFRPVAVCVSPSFALVSWSVPVTFPVRVAFVALLGVCASSHSLLIVLVSCLLSVFVLALVALVSLFVLVQVRICPLLSDFSL